MFYKWSSLDKYEKEREWAALGFYNNTLGKNQPFSKILISKLDSSHRWWWLDLNRYLNVEQVQACLLMTFLWSDYLAVSSEVRALQNTVTSIIVRTSLRRGNVFIKPLSQPLQPAAESCSSSSSPETQYAGIAKMGCILNSIKIWSYYTSIQQYAYKISALKF